MFYVVTCVGIDLQMIISQCTQSKLFPTVDCFWMAIMALWICWFLVMFILVSKGGLIAPFLDLGHCCRCVELPAER